MTTISTTNFLFDGGFFELGVNIDNVSGDGDSAWPTTLTIRADQMDRVSAEDDRITIEFHGSIEFGQFCEAIAALNIELQRYRGRA